MDGDDEGRRWLRAHRGGAATADALAFFDRCPPVAPAALVGRWRGTGLPTGHPFDGLLEGYGWYGKDVLDAETVHPLLFRDARGVPRPVDPAHAPLDLLRRRPEPARRTIARLAWPGVRALRRTRRPAARVRTVEHRGVAGAALVYDRVPVIDVFRHVAAGTVLGVMDLRGMAQPFFFVLDREPAQPSRG